MSDSWNCSFAFVSTAHPSPLFSCWVKVIQVTNCFSLAAHVIYCQYKCCWKLKKLTYDRCMWRIKCLYFALSCILISVLLKEKNDCQGIRCKTEECLIPHWFGNTEKLANLQPRLHINFHLTEYFSAVRISCSFGLVYLFRNLTCRFNIEETSQALVAITISLSSVVENNFLFIPSTKVTSAFSRTVVRTDFYGLMPGLLVLCRNQYFGTRFLTQKRICEIYPSHIWMDL